jgi:sulfite reductase alpha subunit-like flavoprotein
VRARSDQDRTIVANRPGTVVAESSGSSAPARVRPGHNTPLLILYGSNLGTAEDLAHRVADLAEVNGFATKLASLDDYFGNLKDQGGVRWRGASQASGQRRVAEQIRRQSINALDAAYRGGTAGERHL